MRVVHCGSADEVRLFLGPSRHAQGVCHQQGLHFSTASHLRVRWLEALAYKRVGTINPATGDSLGEVGWADPADVDHAVKAAYRGFRRGAA